MNAQEFISSGLLELYVAGVLSEEENQEVYAAMQQYPEVRDEVLKIESAIAKLTAANTPYQTKLFLPSVLKKAGLDQNDHIRPLPKRGISWLTYSGWAAAIIMAVGMLWMIAQNNQLTQTADIALTEKQKLEDQIALANKTLEEKSKLLAILRDENIITVPLAGQAVYPDAYAKVYWDKTDNAIYLDMQGLPDPPEGKVYQVWSLTLNPLTPTSLGIIEQFADDDNKIFAMPNPNASEAFGITLEPTGGSVTPTMEQLYTLGLVVG
jgi:anti-sigma-K factor RskA